MNHEMCIATLSNLGIREKLHSWFLAGHSMFLGRDKCLNLTTSQLVYLRTRYLDPSYFQSTPQYIPPRWISASHSDISVWMRDSSFQLCLLKVELHTGPAHFCTRLLQRWSWWPACMCSETILIQKIHNAGLSAGSDSPSQSGHWTHDGSPRRDWLMSISLQNALQN